MKLQNAWWTKSTCIPTSEDSCDAVLWQMWLKLPTLIKIPQCFGEWTSLPSSVKRGGRTYSDGTFRNTCSLWLVTSPAHSPSQWVLPTHYTTLWVFLAWDDGRCPKYQSHLLHTVSPFSILSLMLFKEFPCVSQLYAKCSQHPNQISCPTSSYWMGTGDSYLMGNAAGL